MKLSKEAKQLAKDLGMSETHAYMWELKAKLYMKSAGLIKESDLTHEQIAKKVGTSRSRINRISRLGETNVSMETLLTIIVVLEGMPKIKFAA